MSRARDALLPGLFLPTLLPLARHFIGGSIHVTRHPGVPHVFRGMTPGIRRTEKEILDTLAAASTDLDGTNS